MLRQWHVYGLYADAYRFRVSFQGVIERHTIVLTLQYLLSQRGSSIPLADDVHFSRNLFQKHGCEELMQLICFHARMHLPMPVGSSN